jgi:hypothetical protein
MNWLRTIWKWIYRKWRWLIELILRIRHGGGGTIADDKCCHLARLDKECKWLGSKANFSCPAGWYRTWWYCCEGTQQIGCGECTPQAETCWTGPWECSIWWYTGATC